ncbi:uncharacterized protein Tco025E_04595 [Trypanosoma conorhini]|uniref:Uncharacterized protein n=1 Tax=Trypanosoma conorhini TaxID=83891 RepID=A0A422PKH1_9TRYP|nr:uncharacterized protein Tco025E_04595 [Trypanosoma conorhini]RNF18210.1 hypothetical protein Tco025E_04595 [Trypanosoma conorhini]
MLGLQQWPEHMRRRVRRTLYVRWGCTGLRFLCRAHVHAHVLVVVVPRASLFVVSTSSTGEYVRGQAVSFPLPSPICFPGVTGGSATLCLSFPLSPCWSLLSFFPQLPLPLPLLAPSPWRQGVFACPSADAAEPRLHRPLASADLRQASSQRAH